MTLYLFLLLFLVFLPSTAMAYIGPGIGVGVFATIAGILGSILLALFAILYYPIKRMIKKFKTISADGKKKIEDSETDTNNS